MVLATINSDWAFRRVHLDLLPFPSLDVPNFMVVRHDAEDLPYHTTFTAITSSSAEGRSPYFPSDYSSCTCLTHYPVAVINCMGSLLGPRLRMRAAALVAHLGPGGVRAGVCPIGPGNVLHLCHGREASSALPPTQ